MPSTIPSLEQIREIIARGAEQSGVEFKTAGVRDDPAIRGKVVRAILAMANRRDGGLVVLGVSDNGGAIALSGLTRLQADSWRPDHVGDTVAEYADPRVVFEVVELTLDEHLLVIIVVQPFDDVPVICKRTLQDGRRLILRSGAVYVRSNRKPESREIANFDEMRSLIDLATDREVRRFVARATQAGMTLGAASTADDAELFANQRGDL